MAMVSVMESFRHRRDTMQTHAEISSSSMTMASSVKCFSTQFRTALMPAISSGMVSISSPVCR
jgi:hypothetical protein